jgi:serine/threonine-protein kinase
VSVPFVEGIREGNAVRLIERQGLEPVVQRRPHDTVREGRVYEQDPAQGSRVDRNSPVEIFVSLGPPKVTVPELVGQSRDDAISELSARGLKRKVVEVFSREEAGTVVAQNPQPGARVDKGSVVRINVSRGLQPVGVPSVVGETFESASSQLQAEGFAVARRDVDSDDPSGIVVRQDPAGGAQAARGATVTLFVSKGPAESTIPDVASRDEATARVLLEEAGFEVAVQDEETDDPNSDGIVLNQDPPGGTTAPGGTVVTIFVGRFIG